MAEVEKVAWVRLVHRHRPEGREIEVPQMLFGPLGRPGRVDVGDVVIRRERLRLERSGSPDAGEGPAIEVRGRRDNHRIAVRHGDKGVPLDEREEVTELVAHRRDELAGGRVTSLHPLPDLGGLRLRVYSSGHLADSLLPSSRSAMTSSRSAPSEMPSWWRSRPSNSSHPSLKLARLRGASVSRRWLA